MNFKIDPGLPENQLAKWLSDAKQKYGAFDDGRVDYSQADLAPIVMCTVVCGDELLLVKRGHGLADANGVWSTVNGFIDEVKPVAEQAQQEIHEELDLRVDLQQIKVAPSYTLKNPAEKRSYIVFPCLVALAAKPVIKLNEENTDFAWLKRPELETYDILADLPYAIDAALAA
ncbi:MAG TPA: NUDIX domain-containing protein [Candidatus Saccharimonadales bacterium]|nr:NUDIX domain-containing protein [Candidatus Saccharimonadales bacterium]